MASDQFQLSGDSVISPARKCFAITPSDSAELPTVAKALYIGTGGDLCLKAADDTAFVTFRNLPDGFIIDVRAIAVLATGTTAADIVGLA